MLIFMPAIVPIPVYLTVPIYEFIILINTYQYKSRRYCKGEKLMENTAQIRWLTVSEFRDRFPQMGRSLIYEAVRKGELSSIRIGGKILIPSNALDRLFEQQNDTD